MTDEPRAESSRVSGRAVVLVLLGIVLLVFFVVNRDDTEVSFVFWEANVSLFVALLISALLGVAVGFIVGRARYRS